MIKCINIDAQMVEESMLEEFAQFLKKESIDFVLFRTNTSLRFYHNIFYMFDLYANVSSNEQIQFKLTQNLIPSFATSRGTLIPLQSSLQYTYSKISIQEMLPEQQLTQDTSSKISSSEKSKNSSLKASSLNINTQSSLKNGPKSSFRQRILSNKTVSIKRNIERKMSFKVVEFEQEKTLARSSLIHSSDSKRCWSQRNSGQRSSSKKENIFSINNSQVTTIKLGSSRRQMDEALVLLDLKKSMKIKQIKLRNDEQREKNYLKRILQARMCSIHPNDELSKSIPLWTSRKTFKF